MATTHANPFVDLDDGALLDRIRAMDNVYIDPGLCAGPWLNALADELYADGAR